MQEAVASQHLVPVFELTSTWLNCGGKGAVISGSKPGAVLLNGCVYMKGSSANDSHKIWKYSIANNTMFPILYPAFCYDLDVSQIAITTYRSQLLSIGRDDHNKLKIFALEDEATDSWKEIMQDIPQLSHTRQSYVPSIVSAASEGELLIVVVTMGYQRYYFLMVKTGGGYIMSQHHLHIIITVKLMSSLVMELSASTRKLVFMKFLSRPV